MPEYAREIDGARLKLVREELGITQVALAKRAGIDQGTVSNLEHGRHRASPRTVRRIADALGVRLEDITNPAGASR